MNTESAIDPKDLINPLPLKEETTYTSRIVGVKFRDAGRVYNMDAQEISLNRGDWVVCEFDERGPMMGFVSSPPYRIFPAEELRLRLKPILRVATDEDKNSRDKHRALEDEAFQLARRAVADRKLPMRIVEVEFPLNGKSHYVYFTSEDRVDFRDLLKDLIYKFKTRVELRQLGSRDETKFVGAIGPCGQETCCSRFINNFFPVSIKMAKDQGLALNPTKVSGMCGRLKCCLAYEQDAYMEAKKGLPKVGGCVKCSGAATCSSGVVQKVDVLKRMVTVLYDDGTSQTLPVSDVLEEHRKSQGPSSARPVAAAAPAKEEEEDIVYENLEDGVTRFVDGKVVQAKKDS